MDRATLIHNLNQAHDQVVALMRTIPNQAIDWSSTADEWSLKTTIGHLAHANDFYVMIIEEARASKFGEVVLNEQLPGRKRMALTDQEIAACTNIERLVECFERAYQRMVNVLQTITPEEMDQTFRITERERTRATSLRERVFEIATEHFYEHQPQLTHILAQWRAAREMNRP